jgi:hypothetical protein
MRVLLSHERYYLCRAMRASEFFYFVDLYRSRARVRVRLLEELSVAAHLQLFLAADQTRAAEERLRKKISRDSWTYLGLRSWRPVRVP